MKHNLCFLFANIICLALWADANPEKVIKYKAMLLDKDELNLKNTDIKLEDIESLVEALKDNNKLIILDLSSNHLGDKEIKTLTKILFKIKELFLENNNITNVGANYLARSLEKNTTLTNLALSRNKIGKQGALAFAEALNKNNALLTLSLESNKIGDKGGIALRNALKKNSTLNSIGLNDNNISDEIIQEIRQQTDISERLVNIRNALIEIPVLLIQYPHLFSSKPSIFKTLPQELLLEILESLILLYQRDLDL